MVSKEKVLKRLQEHWNHAVSLGYNEDRFLGIFSIEECGREYSLIIILPSFEDLCFNSSPIYNPINTTILIKDIRYFLMGEKIFDECILNNRYEKMFHTYLISPKILNISKEGIMEILKYSFAENQPQTASKKEFFKQLTNAETKAYYSIVKEIGEEGNITISKLVEKNSISRPVYNNLITKMKENNVASVVSMGMKGTYIKILEAELKAEAMQL